MGKLGLREGPTLALLSEHSRSEIYGLPDWVTHSEEQRDPPNVKLLMLMYKSAPNKDLGK